MITLPEKIISQEREEKEEENSHKITKKRERVYVDIWRNENKAVKSYVQLIFIFVDTGLVFKNSRATKKKKKRLHI
jgi:hypothetical protein